MSQDSPSNPYAISMTEGSSWQLGSMDYGQSVTYVWNNPNWIANVLLASACLIVGGFIPILPALVLLGYQCEILESLALRPQSPYPDFKLDRLTDYLVRGLWPFLVALIGGLVIVPVVLITVVVPVFVMIMLGSAAGQDSAPVVFVIGIPIIVVLAILVAVACHVFMVPFLLRSALTQDIGASLDFEFAKDFVSKMWKETILAGLFLLVVGVAAELLGLLLLCVGLLFTMPFVSFAKTHLSMQLYRLYISRGGQKIPLKSTPVAVDARHDPFVS